MDEQETTPTEAPVMVDQAPSIEHAAPLEQTAENSALQKVQSGAGDKALDSVAGYDIDGDNFQQDLTQSAQRTVEYPVLSQDELVKMKEKMGVGASSGVPLSPDEVRVAARLKEHLERAPAPGSDSAEEPQKLDLAA